MNWQSETKYRTFVNFTSDKNFTAVVFLNTQFDEIDGPFAVNGLGQIQSYHEYSDTDCNNPVNENDNELESKEGPSRISEHGVEGRTAF